MNAQDLINEVEKNSNDKTTNSDCIRSPCSAHTISVSLESIHLSCRNVSDLRKLTQDYNSLKTNQQDLVHREITARPEDTRVRTEGGFKFNWTAKKNAVDNLGWESSAKELGIQIISDSVKLDTQRQERQEFQLKQSMRCLI